MNILFVTHYTGVYGANKSLLEVIINMKKKFNINAIVITPGIGRFNNELNKNNIENYSFKYYEWVTKKNDSNIKKGLKYIRYKIINYISEDKIVKFLIEKNINIVHTNSSVIDIGANIAKKLNAKHIWHIREFGEEDYNLIYYIGLEKATKFIYNSSDKVICISNILKNKYIDSVDNYKLRLIYNGISEKNYFINIANKNFNKKFNIIFTGLITPNKNQMELLKAMNILINEKKYEIFTYFLGDGNIEYLKKLKKFVEEHNLQENIFFCGRVENIKEYIRKGYVGIISSKSEAFGRVTVEYMMGGLVVIGSNTGANTEIITNDVTGLLYNLGNVDELVLKIEKLYNDRQYLKKLSFKGQAEAMNKFTSDINCKNIYNLYNEVLENKKN